MFYIHIDHNLKILIQQARVSKKLSQKQLALQLNIHESIVSKYDNESLTNAAIPYPCITFHPFTVNPAPLI